MAKEVSLVTDLAIGQADSRIRSDLRNDQERQRFAADLRRHTEALTVRNTVDCMDDRRILRFSDGTDEPATLKRRVAYQLPGGLVLPATKAAVAADLELIRSVKSFTAAYLQILELLTAAGFEDAGHAHCGASALVAASVEQPADDEIAVPTASAVLGMDHHDGAFAKVFADNRLTATRRLQDGFYEDWSADWHEAFLMERVPHNFACYTEEHRADGLYLITEPGVGLAKNAFIDDTGLEAFCVTRPAIPKLVSHMSDNADEQLRLTLAFGADIVNVSHHLIAPGMPVFSEAA